MLKDKPRTGKFAERPGSYEQAIRVLTPVISSGETVEVEQYFTGYGEIKSAKVVFYPSDDFFDSKVSYILNSIKEKTKDVLVFGGNKTRFESTGVTFGLQGFMKEGWEESTLFIDTGDGPAPQVLTETKQDEAPFKYVLTTLRTIKPGTYYLEFYFTYFNGEVWKSSSKKIEFRVQNFFERHDVVIGWLALAATISALARFIVVPTVMWLAALCG